MEERSSFQLPNFLPGVNFSLHTMLCSTFNEKFVEKIRGIRNGKLKLGIKNKIGLPFFLLNTHFIFR
jgi:hypothetical protein